MKIYLLSLLICILFIDCRQKNRQPVFNSQTADTVKTFPVNNFILSDIKDVQQTPYLIYKITITNKKKDSSVITKEEYKNLADQFLQKDISVPSLKILYKESVFHDLTTRSYTITYTATDPSLYVKDLSVLLNDETNKLSRIFIHCLNDNGDSTIIEQYSWKAGKSFSINKYIRRKDGSEWEEEKIVIWNDPV
jgi:hypothetical protein